jgi:hypothetical protein
VLGVRCAIAFGLLLDEEPAVEAVNGQIVFSVIAAAHGMSPVHAAPARITTLRTARMADRDLVLRGIERLGDGRGWVHSPAEW